MNKILAGLLALLGVSGASAQENTPHQIDPKTILFSTPTISNDLAPIETLSDTPSGEIFSFHEDDWSQLEFFPKSQLPIIQRLLSEYKSFEEQNREQYGWRSIYLRKIERVPVVSGIHAASDLAGTLGASLATAPVLYSTGAITGRVASGFSVPLGGNVTLYGYSTNSGIPVLGALVGENPDDHKLTQAFSVLHEKYGLFLVDWRQQLLISGQESDGYLTVWRP